MPTIRPWDALPLSGNPHVRIAPRRVHNGKQGKTKKGGSGNRRRGRRFAVFHQGVGVGDARRGHALASHGRAVHFRSAGRLGPGQLGLQPARGRLPLAQGDSRGCPRGQCDYCNCALGRGPLDVGVGTNSPEPPAGTRCRGHGFRRRAAIDSPSSSTGPTKANHCTRIASASIMPAHATRSAPCSPSTGPGPTARGCRPTRLALEVEGKCASGH